MQFSKLSNAHFQVEEDEIAGGQEREQHVLLVTNCQWGQYCLYASLTCSQSEAAVRHGDLFAVA